MTDQQHSAGPRWHTEQLLLTTVQAAQVLGVSRTTIYELIKQGELHPVHIARCCRLSRAELDRYVTRLDAARPKSPVAEPAQLVQRGRRRTTPTSGQHSLFALERSGPDGDPAA